MIRDEQNKPGHCHRNGVVEFAKPVIMQSAPSFARSYFSIRYLFFQNPVNQMYPLRYRINFVWNAILMNSMK